MKNYIYLISILATIFSSCGKETQEPRKTQTARDPRNLFDLNYLYSACAKQYAKRDPIEMRSDAQTPGEEEFIPCASLKHKLLQNNLSAFQVVIILRNLREGDVAEAKQNTKEFSKEAIENLQRLSAHFEDSST